MTGMSGFIRRKKWTLSIAKANKFFYGSLVCFNLKAEFKCTLICIMWIEFTLIKYFVVKCSVSKSTNYFKS